MARRSQKSVCFYRNNLVKIPTSRRNPLKAAIWIGNKNTGVIGEWSDVYTGAPLSNWNWVTSERTQTGDDRMGAVKSKRWKWASYTRNQPKTVVCQIQNSKLFLRILGKKT